MSTASMFSRRMRCTKRDARQSAAAIRNSTDDGQRSICLEVNSDVSTDGRALGAIGLFREVGFWAGHSLGLSPDKAKLSADWDKRGTLQYSQPAGYPGLTIPS